MTYTPSPAIDLVRALARNPFDKRLAADPLGVGRLLIETALTEGTTERSLLHAHVPGLHSIMLFDRTQTGAGKIRLFYTEQGRHELTKVFDRNNDFTLRPHDHHFPISIVPLVGNLLHTRTEEASHSTNYRLHKFVFQTAVGNDDFGLDYRGEQNLQLPDHDMLVPGDIEEMDSYAIHSVTNYEIGIQSSTSWIVVEGDKEFKDTLLFSREPKPVMDASILYKPATRSDVDRILTDTINRMDRG